MTEPRPPSVRAEQVRLSALAFKVDPRHGRFRVLYADASQSDDPDIRELGVMFSIAEMDDRGGLKRLVLTAGATAVDAWLTARQGPGR